MAARLSGIRWPGWARRTHPIVRNETRYWSHSKAWRLVQALLLAGVPLFILTPAACSLLFGLPTRDSTPVETILLLGGVFTVGLALLSWLAVWFINLSASILGATLIARERESQTWPFLRLTTLTSRDIVGGKLMALFYTLIGPAAILIGLRLLTVGAGLVTLLLAGLASRVSSSDLITFFAPLIQAFGFNPGQWLGAASLGALGLLWTILNWLGEPLFGLVYYGVIALAMSSLVRSRGAAIVLTFGAHFCLALGLYAPISQLGTFFLLPLAAVSDQTVALPYLLVVFGIQFIVQYLLPWVIVAGCLIFVLQRVEVMGD